MKVIERVERGKGGAVRGVEVIRLGVAQTVARDKRRSERSREADKV